MSSCPRRVGALRDHFHPSDRLLLNALTSGSRQRLYGVTLHSSGGTDGNRQTHARDRGPRHCGIAPLRRWLADRSAGNRLSRQSRLPDRRRAAVRRADARRDHDRSFTVVGRENRKPEPDRYDIASVEKVGEDMWRFNASMDCCGVNGTTLPIVVPMRFVGDTPIIMMTDTSLPGIGTFTVRVFFYGDWYAGKWQHGEVGGHMSGRIEKQKAPTE